MRAPRGAFDYFDLVLIDFARFGAMIERFTLRLRWRFAPAGFDAHFYIIDIILISNIAHGLAISLLYHFARLRHFISPPMQYQPPYV